MHLESIEVSAASTLTEFHHKDLDLECAGVD